MRALAVIIKYGPPKKNKTEVYLVPFLSTLWLISFTVSCLVSCFAPLFL